MLRFGPASKPRANSTEFKPSRLRLPARVTTLFLLLIALSVAAFLIGCTDDPDPTPVPAATAAPQPTATPMPEPTPEPAPTSTPEPTATTAPDPTATSAPNRRLNPLRWTTTV